MSGTRVEGTGALLQAMHQVPAEFEREMAGELNASAELLAGRMRRLARKHRSMMALSVRISQPEPLVRDIGPTAEYAAPQEEGIKPGGKGLPRFHDPEAADVIAWLSTQAFRGQRAPRRNSMAAVRQNLELRDRYEGLAWHIRHKGIKPGPFVKPAFDQLEPAIRVRLQAAGERALRLAGGASA